MRDDRPEDSLLAEIEAYAVLIARQAGQILSEQFRQPLEVQFKGQDKSDPVTSADHLADEYLKKAISEKYPSHSILSEEGAALRESDSSFVWAIDPLDGTVNFMNGLPLFAVSVGILWKRQAVAGSIYVPVSQRGREGVYHARLGHGAFLEAEKVEISLKPPERPLSELPIQFGSGFRLSGKGGRKEYEPRNLGSIALEMALAAGGVFQYALFGSPKLWDVAAGVLLVKEAGGLVLVKRAGEKKWLNLERFQFEQKSGQEPLEKLREWSLPLLVGSPEAAGRMATEIQIRRRTLANLASRLWPRKKKAGPASKK